MPTLYAWAESPTAATIFRAAAAVGTSRATMRRWRGSILSTIFPTNRFPSLSGLVELGYGLQQRHRRWLVIRWPAVCWPVIRGLVEFQADLLHSALFEAQRQRSAVGNIDDPVVHYGTPVIDANHHGLAIPQVGYLDQRAQRKAGVSGREIALVEGFSAGRRLALEQFSIPGRGAYLIGLRLRAAWF